VYGMGKNSRYQLGKYQNSETINREIFDVYTRATKIEALKVGNEVYQSEIAAG